MSPKSRGRKPQRSQHQRPDRHRPQRTRLAAAAVRPATEHDEPSDSDSLRRSFALPDVHGEWDGIILDLLNPADEDERDILISAAHPEYAEAIRQSDFRDIEIDGVNPRLHLTLHGIIAAQLYDGDPPEVWRTAQRLTALGYDWHNTHHALMHAMSGQIYRMLEKRQQYDHASYVAALDALPESWETDFKDA